MALKKKDVERFKERLLELRRQLTHHLSDATQEVKSPEQIKGYSQHQADEGTQDYDRTLALQLNTTETEMLRQVDRALQKIEENTYGTCDLTGQPIPLARLEVIPYATLTVQAQERLEKGQI
jgi:DnaK suppressor protein